MLPAGVWLAAQNGTALAAPASEAFPSRPMRLIVPQAPGGQNDMQMRVIAKQLFTGSGQQVIVDNRPGGGGLIGSAIAAKAPADGYTLLAGSISTLAVIPALPGKHPYDVFRDFQPVSQVSISPYILVVHPGVAADSVAEFVKLAKARAEPFRYGSSGNATGVHLTTELFSLRTGIRMVHVPYKGGAPATLDIVAGRIEVMFNNALNALPHLKAGRLRALAVTSAERSYALPNVPTVAESGYPGFASNSWQGLVTVAGTPKEIVQRLHAAIVGALRSEESKRLIAVNGNVIVTSTPAEFGRFIKSEFDTWSQVIKTAGINRD
ncbi:MAG: tripartite tricarboxylate transporter substrate binding protein [Burkholderiales bacterium]|nr:tripartite tricarboxylate transporter substrate binding protein [Burkholderiales bacterium]